MTKEVYNNLIVIINLILLFAFVGLAIHMFHSHPDDIVEGALFSVLAVGHAVGLGLGLYKLFNDRIQ